MLTLFHGSSIKHFDAILKNGLQPRSLTSNSNYKGVMSSHPDLIYLTDVYPLFYAVRAANDGEDVLLLKVKVKESELYPDEDFITQVQARGENAVDLMSRIRELHELGINPRDYKKLWRKSLEHLGTVACEPIPASRIVAHVTAPSDFMKLTHFGADTNPPSGIGISIVKNYLSATYQPRLELLFSVGFEKAYAQIHEEHQKQLALLSKLPSR